MGSGTDTTPRVKSPEVVGGVRFLIKKLDVKPPEEDWVGGGGLAPLPNIWYLGTGNVNGASQVCQTVWHSWLLTYPIPKYQILGSGTEPPSPTPSSYVDCTSIIMITTIIYYL